MSVARLGVGLGKLSALGFLPGYPTDASYIYIGITGDICWSSTGWYRRVCFCALPCTIYCICASTIVWEAGRYLWTEKRSLPTRLDNAAL